MHATALPTTRMTPLRPTVPPPADPHAAAARLQPTYTAVGPCRGRRARPAITPSPGAGGMLSGAVAALYGEIFDAVDADGRGTLGAAEGKTFLRGSGCREEELDYYWADLLRTAVDTNRDGLIGRTDFLTYMVGHEDLDAAGAFADKGHEELVRQQLAALRVRPPPPAPAAAAATAAARPPPPAAAAPRTMTPAPSQPPHSRNSTIANGRQTPPRTPRSHSGLPPPPPARAAAAPAAHDIEKLRTASRLISAHLAGTNIVRCLLLARLCMLPDSPSAL